jgi:small subunit ribosomal protein S20
MVRARTAQPTVCADAPLVHSLAVANIKSQIKRNRQSAKAQERNKGVRSSLKTASKKARTAVAEGDLEAARARTREAAQAFDRAVSKGVLHKRTAARHKSRLAKAANRAAAAETSEG